MARTNITKRQLRFPLNDINRDLLFAKLKEHDSALDVLDANIGGTLTADAEGRAKIAAGFFDAATLDSAVADKTIAADKVANVASGGVKGAIPVVYYQTVASGANGDTDITVDNKFRVFEVVVILKGAGTAGSLLTVKNGATAISDAIDVSAGGDKAIFRASTIDDAQMDVAASGTLRFTKASTGGDFPGAEVYVFGVHVA